jgi:hypothetical protein
MYSPLCRLCGSMDGFMSEIITRASSIFGYYHGCFRDLKGENYFVSLFSRFPNLAMKQILLLWQMRVMSALPRYYIKKTQRGAWDLVLIGLESWKMRRLGMVLMIKRHWPWWRLSLESGECSYSVIHASQWSRTMPFLSIYSNSKVINRQIGKLIGLRN